MRGKVSHDRGNKEPLAVLAEVGQRVAESEYITDYLFFRHPDVFMQLSKGTDT